MTNAAEFDRLSVRSLLRMAVTTAWQRAVAAGRLPRWPEGEQPVEVEVERPADPGHGDFASNLALKLARPYRRSPLEIARALADSLGGEASEEGAVGEQALLQSAEAAAPGFLNLRLDDGFVAASVGEILRQGNGYGHVEAAPAQRIDVEFVSANPTGPLHVGNARGAFVGDFLARILEGAGHQVVREYYLNDAGGQIRELGESVRLARAGDALDEAPYRGDYVVELAGAVPQAVIESAERPGSDVAEVYGRWVADRIREQIEASLARLRVHFDVWTSQRALHEGGWVDRALERLSRSGSTYEAEGALWFRSAAHGDEKDRVLLRSDRSGTYFSSDVGYLEEKFSRGFDRLIYVWGADHHGAIARLLGAAEALGHPRQSVEVLLYSWVRFARGGVEVSMSKRGGTFVTLDELVDEVGVDAARWFFASRAHTSPLDFDVELAKRQAPENPVYYVQYAHARIASILRFAVERGLAPRPESVGLLRDEVELGLARALLRLPEVVEDGAARRETHELAAYAQELAATFHAFYRDRRVVDEAAPEVSGARLALVDATRQVLANTLGLLGISAPDSM